MAAGNDFVKAYEGDGTLWGGAGNDTLDGCDRVDTPVFSGPYTYRQCDQQGVDGRARYRPRR